MTSRTGQGRCRDMIARLGSRRRSGKGLTGMARLARTCDAGVIHRRASKIAEPCCRVATLTGRQRSRYVVARLRHRRDACKHLTVMAVRTATGNSGVHHHRSREAGELACRVTGLARQRGRQVVARFGYRSDTREHLPVMACDTSTQYAGVVHHCAREAGELACRVAVLARQGGRQVVTRFRNRCHTREHLAVMAIDTSTQYTGVAHHCSREAGELGSRVAGLARQRGRQVVARFRHWGDACEHLAIVAIDTIVDDATVVHHTTREIIELARRVAGLTRQSGWQMIARLGNWCHTEEHLTVVAGRTAAGDSSVIHHS